VVSLVTRTDSTPVRRLRTPGPTGAADDDDGSNASANSSSTRVT